MNVTSFTERVGDLVGKDDLKGAIALLHQLMKNSPRLNEVILQSARLTDLTRQISMGTVDFKAANITKNKIRMAVLTLCSEIEENVSQNPDLQEEMNQHSTEKYITRIQQNHYGTGDNVAGDKVVNG